jgi:hypothetical protein
MMHIRISGMPETIQQVNASAMTVSCLYRIHMLARANMCRQTRFETSDLLANEHGESLIPYAHYV